MPITYLDTSALLKLYIPETGSDFVTNVCQTESIAVSDITVAEVASALARRGREGTLSVDQIHTFFSLFLADSRAFTVIDAGRSVTRRAAELLLSAPAHIRLRSLDALHVASAELSFSRARRRAIPTGHFITADRGQGDAATWAGLPVLNPEDYP